MKKSTMNAINSITTVEELNEVINLIKIKQKQIRSIAAMSVKSSMTVGTRVKINSSKGVKYGSINKINRTKAIVNIGGVQYNVPFSLLEVA